MKLTKLLGLITVVVIVVFALTAFLVIKHDIESEQEPVPRGIRALESQERYYTDEGGTLTFGYVSKKDGTADTLNRTQKTFTYILNEVEKSGTVEYEASSGTLTFTVTQNGSEVYLGSLSGKSFSFRGTDFQLSQDANEKYQYAGEQLSVGFGKVFNAIFMIVALIYYVINLAIFFVSYTANLKGKAGLGILIIVLAAITSGLEIALASTMNSWGWILFVVINVMEVVYVILSRRDMVANRNLISAK